jgi:hypothetical protein
MDSRALSIGYHASAKMEDVEKVVRAHLIGLAEDEAGHAQLRALAKVEHADPEAAEAIEALLDGKASEDELEILCGSFLYMVLDSEPDESVALESGACGGADETNFYPISSGHALVRNLDGWLGAFESLDDALNHFDDLFPDVRIEDVAELAEVPEGVDALPSSERFTPAMERTGCPTRAGRRDMPTIRAPGCLKTMPRSGSERTPPSPAHPELTLRGRLGSPVDWKAAERR